MREAAALVTAKDGQFWKDGRPFRFVGFNIRGICHYGHDDAFPWSQRLGRAANLDWVEMIGGRVIRVFCAYRGIDREETGNRLETVLDMAAERDISVIVCLTVYDAHSGEHPRDDERQCKLVGGRPVLWERFFTEGYRKNYLPQTVVLAERFRDHPGIFAWELGHELRNPEDPTAFVEFCHTVTAMIRKADPNHMIAPGFAGAADLGLSDGEKGKLFEVFDFLTIHAFDGRDAEDDIDLAKELNKPIIVEQAGFRDGDRPASTDADIAKWMERGVSGYMQWALMGTMQDAGDGDGLYGMDQALHDDWDDYVAVYQKWAQKLGPKRDDALSSPDLGPEESGDP